MNKPDIQTVNGKPVIINDQIKSFIIHQKTSSNVDYYGFDKMTGRIFIQFKSGEASYIYKGISAELILEAETAESIGKFVTNNLAHKCEMDKFNERLVKPFTALS